MNDLASLGDVFENSMDFEESGTNIDNDSDSDGMILFSGGGHFIMTEKALTDITSKVTELRNNIIK